MKFTTTALLTTLLTTATALPWSFKSATHDKHFDEITFHLTLDKPTTHHRATTPFSKSEQMKMIMQLAGPQICLLLCAPQSISCPTNWEEKNFGSDDEPCWTCCRKEDADL